MGGLRMMVRFFLAFLGLGVVFANVESIYLRKDVMCQGGSSFFDSLG